MITQIKKNRISKLYSNIKVNNNYQKFSLFNDNLNKELNNNFATKNQQFNLGNNHSSNSIINLIMSKFNSTLKYYINLLISIKIMLNYYLTSSNIYISYMFCKISITL